MRTTTLRRAMTLSRGLILGRALYRLWHFCVGLWTIMLVGMVISGQVRQALLLVVLLSLLDRGWRWGLRRLAR
jgi:hypothetical protein